jgi:hypothetical protein
MAALDYVTKLPGLILKWATLSKRVAALATANKELSGDVRQISERVARLEGASSNSSVPELMRQLADLQKQVVAMQAQQYYEGTPPAVPPPTPKVVLSGTNKRWSKLTNPPG